jgi:ABC-type Fe3+/spermidine/putrescine transport system ATPase subunit
MSKTRAELSRAEREAEPGFVRIEGVSKRFGEVVALHEASLDIARGELLTLLGPSGGGKTTLLNLVAGFLAPDTGAIHIDGRPMTAVATYRREIGVLFQNYALFPHMSVAANVAYGLKARRLPKPEIARKVAETLALVRLTGFEERRPRQLSGGQQQRVALARALAISPKVLLLDEPFSALDRHLRGSMQIEVKEIQRKLGVTTIFVTHDQGEALCLSDRIAVLADGRIRQVGTPGEIYRRPRDRFVASFVGDVAVLRGRLERIDGASAAVAVGKATIAVAAETLRGCAPGAAVDVFLRPEQLRIARAGEAPACDGVVVAHAFQGAHVDLHIETAAAVSGRILIRQADLDAPSRAPVGARIAVACSAGEAVAFPAERA